MPKVTIEGAGTFEVPHGKKLVLAIEDAGVDISHRCGGNARCTTCRVRFHSPEPPMGETEKDTLEEDGVLGQFRLSCQIRVTEDMDVKPLLLASEQGWDPGDRPED